MDRRYELIQEHVGTWFSSNLGDDITNGHMTLGVTRSIFSIILRIVSRQTPNRLFGLRTTPGSPQFGSAGLLEGF